METDECRVCRGGPEPNRSLFAPCLCSGSIMYCHQDCLEEWLAHSKKDKCELCNTKYVFSPYYDTNMPTVIKPNVILRSSIAKLFKEWGPFAFRAVFVSSVWFTFVPLSTSTFFRYFMGAPRGTTAKSVSWNSDILCGIVLCGAIVLSFVVIVR
jgi:E3 ubiquitin-protein ligase MARCH6